MMEEYLGIIKLFAGPLTPRYGAECDGKVLTIKGNEALFSILGTQYGGDGKSTFALPNLHDREPNQGTRYIVCVVGAIHRRTKLGSMRPR